MGYRSVLEKAENDAALLVGAASSRRQSQGALAVGPHPPKSDSATADAVQGTVGVPGETDEPARRNPRRSLAYSDMGPPLMRLS
jgi:hypothetical protein